MLRGSIPGGVGEPWGEETSPATGATPGDVMPKTDGTAIPRTVGQKKPKWQQYDRRARTSWPCGSAQSHRTGSKRSRHPGAAKPGA